MMITAYPIDDHARKFLPARGSNGPRYHGNTYSINWSEYAKSQSGAIIRREEKPMSRRDRIRAKIQPKNRIPMPAAEWNRYCQSQKA